MRNTTFSEMQKKTIYECFYLPPIRVLFPEFYLIEGRLFIDRSKIGKESFIEKVNEYENIADAQKWLNICLIEHILDEILKDDWSFGDDEARFILSTIKESWVMKLNLLFPDVKYEITEYIDDEYGDFGLSLVNNEI